MNDLVPFIDQDKSEILNTESKFYNVLQRKRVRSDADAELLLHIEFKQAVSINEFCLYCREGNKPAQVSLYNGFLSFDDVHSTKPIFTQKCSWKLDCSKSQIPFNKLRSVGELTVFIPGNDTRDPDELTDLDGIGIFGSRVETADTRNSKHQCG